MFDAARNLGEALLTGQRSGLAFAALGIAAAAYTAIFYRLAILREGMSEYGRILGDRRDYAWASTPRRDSQSPTSSLLARIQLAAIDKRLRAVRNVFAAGTCQRVRHWRLSGELSGSKWQAALGIAGRSLHF